MIDMQFEIADYQFQKVWGSKSCRKEAKNRYAKTENEESLED